MCLGFGVYYLIFVFSILGVESISVSILSMLLDLYLVFVGVCWVGFCFSSLALVLEIDRFLFLIVSVSFFWLEFEGMFFDLSVGVSCTLGIIVLRVLISSCWSFIKFDKSSSISIVFICVFASFSTWFEGVLVTCEKVNLFKGIFYESSCFRKGNVFGDFHFDNFLFPFPDFAVLWVHSMIPFAIVTV